MTTDRLDNNAWGVFRIFLSQLEDPELDLVCQQLQKEVASRQECDKNWARLFFSSLTATDLEMARQQIMSEQTGRIEDSKILKQLALTAKSSLRHSGSDENRGQGADVSGRIPLACGGSRRDECMDRVRQLVPKEEVPVMATFTIGNDNRITVFGAVHDIASCKKATELVFNSQTELARISAGWPMRRLVGIYNALGNEQVGKFADRKEAVERIWRAIQPPARNGNAERRPPPQSTQGSKSTKATKAAKRNKSGESYKTINASIKGRQTGGKKAAVLAMMKRARGVSLVEIVSVTGWQAHTVRGLVSVLGSKGGVKIESSKNAGGVRTYRIPK